MPSATGNAKALVTLLVGHPSYRENWQRYYEGSWRAYAERRGYDIVVIDRRIDDGPRGHARSLNWQKCLILEHEDVRGYKDVVWIDADVMINPHAAPCIVERNDSDKIGLVSYKENYFGLPHVNDNTMLRRALIGREENLERTTTVKGLYELAALDPSVGDMANTGVMVLKDHHADVLRHVYDEYEENAYTAKEELPLSHYIYGNDLANSLDRRFNEIWPYHVTERYPFLLLDEFESDPLLLGACVNSAWTNSYFLHFTHDLSDPPVNLVVQYSTALSGLREFFVKLEAARS